MDLQASVNALKSGSGIISPGSSSASSLTAKISQLLSSPVPAIVTYAQSLQATVTSATSAISSITSSIQTRLPMMKAADSVSAKLSISQGTAPPAGGSAAFNSAFAPLDVASTQLSTLDSGLSPAVMARLQAGTTTDLASLNASCTAANSAVSASISSASSAVSDQISTLKAYSFSKFMSMPQPDHVQSVLSKTIQTKPSTESAMADSALAAKIPNASTASYLPMKTSSGVESSAKPLSTSYSAGSARVTNLARIGYTGGTAFADFKNAYMDYANGLSSQADTYRKTNIDTPTQTAIAWRDVNIPNYNDLKKAATNNPSDANAVSAYNAAKQRFLTEGGYAQIQSSIDAYKPMRDNVIRLRDQWSAWVNNDFATATAGPPW